MLTFFRWLAITLAAMMALLLMAVLVLSLLDVTIDLDHLRGGVETSAGAALGRDVSIRGGACGWAWNPVVCFQPVTGLRHARNDKR